MGKGGGGVLGKKFPSEVLHPRYHITPLFPTISKHRGGGAAGRMTVGQKVRTGVLRSRKVRAGVLKENSNFELFLSCTIQNWLH